jgi:hypothetical protein
MRSAWQHINDHWPGTVRPDIVIFIKDLFHAHVRLQQYSGIPGVCICWGNYTNKAGMLTHREDYHFVTYGVELQIEEPTSEKHLGTNRPGS